MQSSSLRPHIRFEHGSTLESASYYLSAWQRLPWDRDELGSAVIDPSIGEMVAAAAYVESHSFEEGRKARALGLTKNPPVRQFFETWLAEESEHGRALAFLARSQGLEPDCFQRRRPGHVHRALATVGLFLLRRSRLAASVALGVGAAAEYMTRAMYLVFAARSEDPAVRRLFTDLASQEGRHLGFFLGAAKASHPDANPLQLKLTGLLLRRIWLPVGVDRLGLTSWLSAFGPLFSDPAFAYQMSRMDLVLDRIPVMRGLQLMSRFQARHGSRFRPTDLPVIDGVEPKIMASAQEGRVLELQPSRRA